MAIITGYKAPEPVNPFAKDIDDLVDAGEGAAYELIANTNRVEGQPGTISSQKARFQDAARSAGYSAKVTENDVREDGTTRVVFILAPKRTRQAKATASKTEAKNK